MTHQGPRFAIVASTAGSVMNQVLQHPFFRSIIQGVVVDRPCEAVRKATQHGLAVETIFDDDNNSFCEKLTDYLRANHISYVLSFYTKFYSQDIRDAYQDRIINFHPSILPAFKGTDGFGDQVRYHVKFIGATVEFIDQAMDEGKIIMQTLFPYDSSTPVTMVRHRLFVQQCRSMLQVARWLWEGRIDVSGRCVTVRGAHYEDSEYSPSLDFKDAVELVVPFAERG